MGRTVGLGASCVTVTTLGGVTTGVVLTLAPVSPPPPSNRHSAIFLSTPAEAAEAAAEAAALPPDSSALAAAGGLHELATETRTRENSPDWILILSCSSKMEKSRLAP